MKYFFIAINGIGGTGIVTSIAVLLFIVFGSVGATTASAAYTVNYSYDKAGRLTKASYDKSNEIKYTYDPTGNLVSLTRIGSTGFPWAMFLPAIINNKTDSILRSSSVIKEIDLRTVPKR
jgi:YD repeat-containing protein